MKVNDYLNELRKIKDVAMATVDSDGYPQIRLPFIFSSPTK